MVRSQDLFSVVRYVSYNPLGQSMAWDWTTLNWDYLVKRSVSKVTATYVPVGVSFGWLVRLYSRYNRHQRNEGYIINYVFLLMSLNSTVSITGHMQFIQHGLFHMF